MTSFSLVPGELFAGDFMVERELFEGGMGVVYVAVQRSTGQRRALKVMQPMLVSSKDTAKAEKNRERFLAEARVGGSIASEHVVQVVVAGIDAQTGAPWLAMELLEGSDLKDALAARGSFAPAEVLDIYQQLTHALSAAHRMGVFHLDIKPENIFLARSNDARVTGPKVKILDFGIAKLVSEHRQSATVTTAMGSPFWMSPEQAQRGAKVGAYSDVWALGLIAFRLLTGKHYWREANVPDEQVSVTSWLMEMMTGSLDPASARAQSLDVAQWIPPGFDAWFSRCVNREVGQRFRDASEAYSALSPVLLGSGRPSVPYARTQHLSEPPRIFQTPPVPPPPSVSHPPRTEPRTQQVSGLVVPRAPSPPGVTFEFAVNRIQSSRSESEGRKAVQAVVVVGAGLVAVAFIALGAKFMGDDGNGTVNSAPASSVEVPWVPPAPSSLVAPRPAPAPSCPAGMVLIPEGTFQMGSPEGVGEADEHPQHEEHVTAFCMDRTEVTVAAYRGCATAGACSPPSATVAWANISSADRRTYSRWCNANFEGRDTHPANCVDWNQSDAFCLWRGAQLPSEAQWEYAARGTDGRSYPLGK